MNINALESFAGEFEKIAQPPAVAATPALTDPQGRGHMGLESGFDIGDIPEAGYRAGETVAGPLGGVLGGAATIALPFLGAYGAVRGIGRGLARKAINPQTGKVTGKGWKGWLAKRFPTAEVQSTRIRALEKARKASASKLKEQKKTIQDLEDAVSSRQPFYRHPAALLGGGFLGSQLLQGDDSGGSSGSGRVVNVV
jgi:hypothetical protein